MTLELLWNENYLLWTFKEQGQQIKYATNEEKRAITKKKKKNNGMTTVLTAPQYIRFGSIYGFILVHNIQVEEKKMPTT